MRLQKRLKYAFENLFQLSTNVLNRSPICFVPFYCPLFLLPKLNVPDIVMNSLYIDVRIGFGSSHLLTGNELEQLTIYADFLL